MEAITWAMHARGLGPVAWRMLVTLANRVNNERDDFDVWPSHRQTAEDCEISVATVKRHLSDLVDAGYLEVIAQERNDGSRTSNRYRLAVRKIVRMPDRDIVIVPAGMPTSRPVQPVSYPPAQDEPAPGSLLNHAMNLPIEPIQVELDSPLPTVEAPSRDLLGDLSPVDPRSVDLVDYVQAEWAKVAAEYPRIQKLRVVSESRKKKIRARAKTVTDAAAGALTAHDVWDQVFDAIRASDFLRGEAPPTRHYPTPFSLSIDYITRPAVFLQTLERYTIDVERNQHTHSDDGRRFGPAEQAMREILASMGLDR